MAAFGQLNNAKIYEYKPPTIQISHKYSFNNFRQSTNSQASNLNSNKSQPGSNFPMIYTSKKEMILTPCQPPSHKLAGPSTIHSRNKNNSTVFEKINPLYY